MEYESFQAFRSCRNIEADFPAKHKLSFYFIDREAPGAKYDS